MFADGIAFPTVMDVANTVASRWHHPFHTDSRSRQRSSSSMKFLFGVA
jgi:hypothetical protein